MASETRSLEELTAEYVETGLLIPKREAVLANYTAKAATAKRKHNQLRAIATDAAATALEAEHEHASCERTRKSQENFVMAAKYRRTELAREIHHHPDDFEKHLAHAGEDIKRIYGGWEHMDPRRLARVSEDLGVDLPQALEMLANYVREFKLTVTFALNPKNESSFTRDAIVYLRNRAGDVELKVYHRMDRARAPPQNRDWSSNVRVFLGGREAICTGRGRERPPYNHCMLDYYAAGHAKAKIPIPPQFSPDDPNSIPNRMLTCSFLTYLYSWFPHDCIDKDDAYKTGPGERPILAPWEFVCPKK